MVVLGAGASVDCGLCTLDQVFTDPQVQAMFSAGIPGTELIQELFWNDRGLTARTAHKGPNIEEILSTVLDWQSDNLIGQTQAVALRRAIYAIVWRAAYLGKQQRALHLNELIKMMDERFDECTWATFNWDCKWEQSFYWSMGKSHPAYPQMLRNSPTPIVEKHKLLKLHGGVNWWFNEDGDTTYIPFASHAHSDSDLPVVEQWTRYEDDETNLRPAIVEPCYDKRKRILGSDFFSRQWGEFEERLARSDLVVFAGYSLPEGDLHAKYSIVTAIMHGGLKKTIVVDPKKDTIAKYHRIISSSVIQIQSGLADALPSLRANL